VAAHGGKHRRQPAGPHGQNRLSAFLGHAKASKRISTMTMTALDTLEATRCQLLDQWAAESDPAAKRELMAAADALNCEIEARYDAGERYACQSAPKIDTDARREGKDAAKEMLRRVLKSGGQFALDTALNLIGTPGMTIEEIERVATKVQPERGTLLNRPGAITAIPAPRLANKPDEEAWLREARAHAESEWAKAHGAPIRRDIRTPWDIALAEACTQIAMQAAGLIRNEDGQKRFNSSRPDEEDARLFRAGEASARKIWPGR
jgi:hypothetical protein